MKAKRLTEIALLEAIIDCWPVLTTMEVAAPRGFGISGRNRLNELSKKYKFKYTHCPLKGNDPGHYDFSDTGIKRFEEILAEEKELAA